MSAKIRNLFKQKEETELSPGERGPGSGLPVKWMGLGVFT
jgi:hypothetical protein